MPAIQAVITDLDNTLYSWVDYIVPSLEAMVDSLVRSTGFPRIEIIRNLKRVYTARGTNEYAFAIQETEFWRSLAEDLEPEVLQELVLEPARRAFNEKRRKYLRLYRGVPEGLRGLRDRGVLVVALTDAPRNAAEARLKNTPVPVPGGEEPLDAFVAALYCQPGYAVPAEAPASVREREENGYYRSGIRVVEVPAVHEKPSPEGILAICRDYGLDPARVVVVGDNRAKDVVAAQAAGCVDVWAEYGTYVSPEYRERLDLVSARAVTRRHVSDPSAAASPTPRHRISNFELLLPLVDELGVAAGWGRVPAPAR